MKKLLIVWHSMTGGAEQMACAAADAARTVRVDETPAQGALGADDARTPGAVEVWLQHARQTTVEDMTSADGYLFVTPENLASMAGLMKDFFDRIYYAALDHINGRPYAILVCAGSDGAGAVRQIQRIATGLRLHEVAAAVIVNTAAETPAAILAPKRISEPDLHRCGEVGAGLAAGLASGVF